MNSSDIPRKSSEINQTFNVRAFSSDVLIFSLGKFIILFFGAIQSLIIPKYFTTIDYGYWQLFLLLTTYVGILHFGFLDGILVSWAGKEIEELKEEIPVAFRFLILEQMIIVGILMLVVGIINLPAKEIAIGVLANAIIINLLTFFLFTAQATRRFKLVTGANIGKGSLFLLFVVATFLGGHFGYIPLIFGMMCVNSVIILFFIFYFRDLLFYPKYKKLYLFKFGKKNIGIGIFILLANFIALIFTTIDRLTVGAFFPINQFAIYAFAMTMCGLAIVFLQAVSQVFFPYLSGAAGEMRIKAFNLLRPALVIFWAGILAVYFPFSVWIKYFLPQYAESLPVMAILLCTVGFSGQIQILHANYFKVYRKQQAYFILAGVSLIFAVILNLFAVFFFGTLIAIATTAVISFCIWYFLNEVTLRHLVAVSFREMARWVLIISAYISAFLGAYMLTESWIIAFSIYVVLFAGITAVFLRREMKHIWSIFGKILNQREDV